MRTQLFMSNETRNLNYQTQSLLSFAWIISHIQNEPKLDFAISASVSYCNEFCTFSSALCHLERNILFIVCFDHSSLSVKWNMVCSCDYSAPNRRIIFNFSLFSTESFLEEAITHSFLEHFELQASWTLNLFHWMIFFHFFITSLKNCLFFTWV